MKRQGFTLVEMSIVLVIIGLATAMILPVSSSMLDYQKRQTVKTNLAALDVALANFVAQNGRLPCPANGTVVSPAPAAGVETLVGATGLCNPVNQVNGVIPWVTLNIPQSAALDPWGGLITYRVYPPLAMRNPAISPIPNTSGLMDMTSCDTAGTGTAAAATPLVVGANTCRATYGAACTQCSPNVTPCNTANLGNCVPPAVYLVSKGLPVSDGAGNWLNNPTNNALTTNGAAYITISAGPTGAGAYNTAGVLQPGTIPAGTNEILNANNTAIWQVVLPAGTGVIPNSYRDAALNDVPTANHFAQYLSHPTIMTVLQNANRGPRAH